MPVSIICRRSGITDLKIKIYTNLNKAIFRTSLKRGFKNAIFLYNI